MNLTVEIDVLSKDGGKITGAELPNENNISGGFESLDGSKSEEQKNKRPFVLGASRMGLGDRFFDTAKEFDGYMSRTLTDTNGETDCILTIKGTAIENFVIQFDKITGQWAEKVWVDNTEYANDDYQFAWSGDSADSHIVRITKWNIPLYPVRIKYIAVGLTVTFDRSNLCEAIRGSESTADNKLPKYGIISQYGSLTLIDHDGEIKDIAELNALKSFLDVKIKLDGEEIGVYKTEKWKYSYGNNKVSVGLCDGLLKWQNILFPGFSYEANQTAYDVFLKLNKLSKLSGNVVELEPETETFLKSINIACCYMENSTLFEAWNKLCNISQMQIYMLEDGKVTARRCQ